MVLTSRVSGRVAGLDRGEAEVRHRDFHSVFLLSYYTLARGHLECCVSYSICALQVRLFLLFEPKLAAHAMWVGQ